MSGEVLFQHDSGLAILTLARPGERNALSFELLGALNESLEQVATNESVHVALLRAEGPAFCAGMNLKTVALDDPAQAKRFAHLLAATYGRLIRLPVPLLCGVDGPAMGGGLGLALAADLVWAGPNARFALPETSVGLVPALVSVVARRRVSAGVLAGMALAARATNAEDALRLGLTDFLASKSAAEEAEAQARRILCENSGEAMRRTKAFLQNQYTTNLDRELEDAIAEFRSAAATESCQLGLKAFRAKKTPVWNDGGVTQ